MKILYFQHFIHSFFPPPLTPQSKDVQHSLFHALLTLPPPSHQLKYLIFEDSRVCVLRELAEAAAAVRFPFIELVNW